MVTWKKGRPELETVNKWHQPRDMRESFSSFAYHFKPQNRST